MLHCPSHDVAKPDLANKSFSAHVSAPSFRVFLGIADKWGLRVEERTKLMGGISNATYYNWKSQGAHALEYDHLERLSLILGIEKGLQILLPNGEARMRWLKSENSDMPFSGHSPFQTMLRGSIDDLYGVRRYIDGWRGSWP